MKAWMSSLLLATTLAACGDAEPSREPAATSTSGETMLVQTVPLTSVQPVDGTVQARRQAVVSTRIMARITSLEVEVGDRVAAGQILLRLGTDDVAANRSRAEASLRMAEAARDEAARHATRMDTLYTQDAVPMVQRDQARLGLVQAEAQVTLAEAALQDVATAAGYAALRAPFAGMVVSRVAAVGDLAAPGCRSSASPRTGRARWCSACLPKSRPG